MEETRARHRRASRRWALRAPRWLVALVPVLVALVSAALPSAASAHGHSVRTLHFIVTVGPAGQEQQCNIIGDLYKPDDASAAHPDPSVLTTNGFGGSKNDQAAMAEELASEGYVVLSYSGLGFGGSGCPIELDDPDWDGKAASQLITFLGAVPPPPTAPRSTTSSTIRWPTMGVTTPSIPG
jgi:hypothetical protein